MRKILLFATLLIAAVVARGQAVEESPAPSYQELEKIANEAIDGQDYPKAYRTFREMDSLYGIPDNAYMCLMNMLDMSHVYDSGSVAEKNLMFRMAGIKWFDMWHLDRDAKNFKSDTLDYWNEIVALVSPRGYHDTVYQNRLLAMMRTDRDLRRLASKWEGNRDSIWAEVHKIEAANEAQLKQLIAERGFPTWTKVGQPSNQFATYVVQFASKEFRRWYMQELLKAIDNGDSFYDGMVDDIIQQEDLNRPNLDTAYQAAIHAMCEEDQRLRNLLDDDDADKDSLYAQIIRTDSLHVVRLKQLIDQYGFPTFDNVGHPGVNEVSLIAQHSNPEFLHWFLEQARQALASENFDRNWIAYMTDRDLLFQGKPQLYGTQLQTIDGVTAFYPIEDVENLDARRRSMVLGPISDYMALYGMKELVIHPAAATQKASAQAQSPATQNRYSIRCVDGKDSIMVSVARSFVDEDTNYLLLSSSCEIRHTNLAEYSRRGDTIFFKQGVKELQMEYAVPKYYYLDSAICLRRENNWYPRRNGELLTASVELQLAEDSYYVICGEQKDGNRFYVDTAYEIHLVMLPKARFVQVVKEDCVRSHYFYRSIADTSHHEDAYYSEFTSAYDFYSSFFGDSLSRVPMNIVEIGDPQFMLCQSLQDLIIFGGYFYQVYTMMPDFSWIPHEVSHQWWGNRIFFEYRDYVLGESLNEYIKLQFLKHRRRGYEEQMDYYQTMMQRATERLPIADIHRLDTMDETIAIYHTAPYTFEQLDSAKACAALRKFYRQHKNTLVRRDVFEQECGIFTIGSNR